MATPFSRTPVFLCIIFTVMPNLWGRLIGIQHIIYIGIKFSIGICLMYPQRRGQLQQDYIALFRSLQRQIDPTIYPQCVPTRVCRFFAIKETQYSHFSKDQDSKQFIKTISQTTSPGCRKEL